MREKLKGNAALYYGLIALLRVSMLMLLMLAFVYWAVLVSITMNVGFFNHAEIKFANPEEFNADLADITNRISRAALSWTIASTLVLAALSSLRRVRDHDKRLLITSFISIAFLYASVVFGRQIIRAFVSTL